MRHKYIQSIIYLRKSWNKMIKTHIFEIMNGNFITGANPRLERHVRNEFAESSDCLMAYNKIYEARGRMGVKMYGYGAYFTGRAKTAPDVPDFYGNAEIIEKDRFN